MTRITCGITSFVWAVVFVVYVSTDYTPNNFTLGLAMLMTAGFFALLAISNEGGRANERR